MKPRMTCPGGPTSALILTAILLAVCSVAHAQTSDDLWDVTQGTTVLSHSPLLGSPWVFDAQSIFGLTFPGGTEPANVIFADGSPLDVPQFVEWRTASPVIVTQVVVYAAGQDVTWDYAREYVQVSIRARSAGAPDFDVELLSNYRRFPLQLALTLTNLPLVTAQEFRAEFLPYPTKSSGPPYGLRTGCRIMELDAFGTVESTPARPVLSLDTHAGIRIEGSPGRRYRIEFATTAGTTDWTTLTNLILPSTPFTILDPTPVSEEKRFYRAVEVPFP